MLWPLYVTRTVAVRRRIRASVAAASEITTDAKSFAKLQPFVTKVTQDASNPRLYRITERIPVLFGLWQIENSFQVMCHPVEDHKGRGMDFSCQFTLSFLVPRLESSVRVKDVEAEPGTVEVVETLTIEVFCLLAFWIVGLVEEAHQVLMTRLEERVQRST